MALGTFMRTGGGVSGVIYSIHTLCDIDIYGDLPTIQLCMKYHHLLKCHFCAPET